jgi:hypothetical protein
MSTSAAAANAVSFGSSRLVSGKGRQVIEHEHVLEAVRRDPSFTKYQTGVVESAAAQAAHQSPICSGQPLGSEEAARDQPRR